MNNLARFLPAVLLTLILGGYLGAVSDVYAQYGSACSKYGVMAYEDYSGYCKCMSGYVFQDTAFGSQCVSADSVCHDKLGIMSRYNSLSDSCECSMGYVFGEDSIGRTQCISETQACQNQLGYHSTAFAGQCKCTSGYVIDTNMLGQKQCTDGDQVCHRDHGYNSSYNSFSNKCECDDDYTFDDNNQCVEKQHNVYFKLLDINPEDDKELLIKSDYDYSKYIVKVGIGCYGSTIERYRGKNLVVNLGTDYYVDTYDTVVLQDDDQVCSIVSREKTFEDSFPEPEAAEDAYFYVPSPVTTYTPPTPSPEPARAPQVTATPAAKTQVAEVTDSDTEISTDTEDGILASTTDIADVINSTDTTPTSTNVAVERESIEPEPAKEVGFFAKIFNYVSNLFSRWF